HFFVDVPLSYALQLWVELLEQETGWGLQQLFTMPPHTVITFQDTWYIEEAMRRIVKRAIAEQNLQPILDAVRQMPCEEDFEPYYSNARKDFIRKWYHTRSKRVKTISLDECLEDDEHGIHEIEDVSAGFADKLIAEDYYGRFKAQLSPKDMAILELRVEGFTYEEIADKLGYKNHSGVLKRMRFVKKKYIEYEKKAGL
ncbi:MAG TPA: hypothetical protein DEB31_08740, partial [Clostridiales bacterium]|nr:hypothetical protein [Clostridiales bacterium]